MSEQAPSATPALDRLREVHERSQACGEFLDWLQSERGLALCEYRAPDDGEHERYLPAMISATRLLAEFFEVDLDAVERERAQLLEQMREATRPA